jgi:NADH pyrophosphatase NudC (nudix superfamily)
METFGCSFQCRAAATPVMFVRRQEGVRRCANKLMQEKQSETDESQMGQSCEQRAYPTISNQIFVFSS